MIRGFRKGVKPGFKTGDGAHAAIPALSFKVSQAELEDYLRPQLHNTSRYSYS
jgi:hypothetical protein